jgi:general secretion pathway protein K
LALVAVLWMVAALSLLVLSISAGSRADVRLAGHLRDQTVFAALGDGAIEWALLAFKLAADAPSETAIPTGPVRSTVVDFEGQRIEVRAIPAQAFINLNTAPEPLLKALWLYAGGMDERMAETLAQRIIDWRDPDASAQPLGAERDHYLQEGMDAVPRDGPFESKTDLLQVMGVDLERYARVEPLLTVHGRHAGVNPLAASLPVLEVLAMGNEAAAFALFDAAQTGQPGADTTRLEQSFIEQGAGPVYRFEARMTSDENRVWVRARWVDLSRVGPLGEPRFIIENQAVFSEERR